MPNLTKFILSVQVISGEKLDIKTSSILFFNHCLSFFYKQIQFYCLHVSMLLQLEKRTTTHSSILAWRISMDRGAWQATVDGVEKSLTRLSDQHSSDSQSRANLHCLIPCGNVWKCVLPSQSEDLLFLFSPNIIWLMRANLQPTYSPPQSPLPLLSSPLFLMECVSAQ